MHTLYCAYSLLTLKCKNWLVYSSSKTSMCLGCSIELGSFTLCPFMFIKCSFSGCDYDWKLMHIDTDDCMIKNLSIDLSVDGLPIKPVSYEAWICPLIEHTRHMPLQSTTTSNLRSLRSKIPPLLESNEKPEIPKQ